MKYKVGDKVRVKSLEWYNKNKNESGKIFCNETEYFLIFMSKFCGSILTIKNIEVDIDVYAVEENGYYWTDDMFEGLAEDTTQPVILKNIIFSNKNYIDKVELCLGKNYEIVVEGDKTFVQRKKIKYPTTYEECCQYLGCNDKINAGKLILFQQLINARNAYWKIAGEEMGLGKSWKFENPAKRYVFTIEYSGGKIILNAATSSMFNRILVFPTEEMRDAFYENFKELIEKCKELL